MSEEKGFYISDKPMSKAKVIAEKTIAYRPSLKNVTGSTNGAILLQQIAWYWYSNKERPFYKFMQPCTNPDYREGDSWCETLNFTYSEITTCLTKFAIKIEAGMPKNELAKQYAVIYWTDSDRITWWQFNEDVFEDLLDKSELLGNSEKSNYLDNSEVSNYIKGINQRVPENKDDSSKSNLKSKPDLLDGIIHFEAKPQSIKKAISEHFKLQSKFSNKFDREWMEWAVENITPEQIARAAEKWRSDKKFSWQVPTLKGIYEKWDMLMDGGSSNVNPKEKPL